MENEKTLKFIMNAITGIIITEIVCISLLLLTVFTTKMFFKDTFLELKDYYFMTLCLDTDIYEVLGENDET